MTFLMIFMTTFLIFDTGLDQIYDLRKFEFPASFLAFTKGKCKKTEKLIFCTLRKGIKRDVLIYVRQKSGEIDNNHKTQNK